MYFPTRRMIQSVSIPAVMAFCALLASGCNKKDRQTEPESISGAGIANVEPSRLDRYGLQPLRIHGLGTEFEKEDVKVLFVRGADTLRFASPEIFNDTALGITFDMADTGMTGKWDVIAETGSKRLVLTQGLHLERPNPWISHLYPNALGMNQDGVINVLAGGSSFDLGPVSIWLKKGSDSLAAEVETISAGSVRGLFRVPKDAQAGYWDLHLAQPWYSILKPSSVLVLMSAIQVGPDASVRANPDTLRTLDDHVIRIHCRGIDLAVFRANPQGIEFRFSGNAGEDVSIHKGEILDDSTVGLRVGAREGSERGYRDLILILNNEPHLFRNVLFLDLPAPEIVSIAPMEAFVGWEAKVIINAVNTRFTQGARTVWLVNGGQTIGASLTPLSPNQSSNVVSDTEMEAFFKIPNHAAPGPWTVKVERPEYALTSRQTIAVKAVPQPHTEKVVSIHPASARRGEKLSLTITGQDVEFLQGTMAHVKVSLVNGAKTIYRGEAMSGQNGIQESVTADLARTTFGDDALADTLPLGTYDVHASYWKFPASQSEGRWVELEPLRNGFTAEEYLRGGPPRIVSVTPDTIYEGETPLKFTIIGENTSFTDSARFEFKAIRGGFQAVPVSVVGNHTDDSITLTINGYLGYTSSGSFSYYQLVFPQNGGLLDLKLRNPFVIERGILPVVASITPMFARSGDSLELLVTCKNVDFGQGAASHVIVSLLKGIDTVFSGKADSLGSTRTQAKIIAAAIPMDASLGYWDVNVRYFIPHASNVDSAGKWVDLKPLIGQFLVMAPVEPASTLDIDR